MSGQPERRCRGGRRVGPRTRPASRRTSGLEPARRPRRPSLRRAVRERQEYCLECGRGCPRRRGSARCSATARAGAWAGTRRLDLAGAARAARGRDREPSATRAEWRRRRGSRRRARAVVRDERTRRRRETTHDGARRPTATATRADRPATRPPPPPPPPAGARRLAGRAERGWTIVLDSLPATNGRAGAVGEAKRRSAAGLDEVGVLDSSRFASLHPGYYVVFSGIYDTPRRARGAGHAYRETRRGETAIREITYARRITVLTVYRRSKRGQRLCNTAPMSLDSVLAAKRQRRHAALTKLCHGDQAQRRY